MLGDRKKYAHMCVTNNVYPIGYPIHYYNIFLYVHNKRRALRRSDISLTREKLPLGISMVCTTSSVGELSSNTSYGKIFCSTRLQRTWTSTKLCVGKSC